MSGTFKVIILYFREREGGDNVGGIVGHDCQTTHKRGEIGPRTFICTPIHPKTEENFNLV